MSVIKLFVDNLEWTLKDIDDTNLETLLDFLFYKDPNVKYINGNRYERSNKPPSWM